MRDIQNPKLMYLKAALFLGIGVLSAGMVLMDHPTIKTFALLVLTVWSFARLYYFFFYVIEHYIDPEYHFAGFGSFVQYLMRKRRKL